MIATQSPVITGDPLACPIYMHYEKLNYVDESRCHRTMNESWPGYWPMVPPALDVVSLDIYAPAEVAEYEAFTVRAAT